MDIQKQIKVAHEIVDTETNYINKIESLMLFLKHAKALKTLNKEVMSDREITDVFMNIEEINNLNREMCNSLVKLRYKGDEKLVKGISSVLLTFTPFMKIYANYTDKYGKAIETLENLKKRPDFVEFLKLTEMIVDEDLSSLLIMPVQRIPRYILLMKELLKVSDKGIPADVTEKMKTNIASLQNMAESINRKAKNTEARDRVVYVQKKIFKNSINIIAPHRVVITMGKMIIKDKSSVFKKELQSLFVLCNDLLLIGTLTNSKKNIYKMKIVIPLEIIMVNPSLKEDGKNDDCGFYIVVNNTGFKNIEVIAKDKETRNRWCQNILFKKKEILEENKRTNSRGKTLKELEQEVACKGSNSNLDKSTRRPTESTNSSTKNSTLKIKENIQYL